MSGSPGAAHTVAVDSKTDNLYFAFENIGGRPVLRVMAAQNSTTAGPSGPSQNRRSALVRVRCVPDFRSLACRVARWSDPGGGLGGPFRAGP